MTNKVILITDLHIKLDRKAMDIDTKANFNRVLSSIKKWEFDHLIIAGDICFQQPENQVYLYVKSQLDDLNFPYSIINGNHDDPEIIVNTFNMHHQYNEKDREIYFTKTIGERSFIFLDTQKGAISKTQLEWLKDELESQKNAHPLIVMHYPPFLSGVPHMDNNYSLANMEAVQSIFFNYKKPLIVFTGHYHVEKTVLSKNVSVFITPSCFVQIDQQEDDFIPDHFQIGYRVIDFDKDTLHTSVHYIL